MLPAANRLRSSIDIARVTRSGVRVRRGSVVVHLGRRAGGGSTGLNAPRIGLAVGRPVGNSVVRHRVARRLRAVSRELLPQLPPQVDLVIRAMPSAGTTGFRELDQDVRDAVQAACTRAGLT